VYLIAGRCCRASISQPSAPLREPGEFLPVYDLRRLKTEQTHLYLLCYAWQATATHDNLVDALGYQ